VMKLTSDTFEGVGLAILEGVVSEEPDVEEEEEEELPEEESEVPPSESGVDEHPSEGSKDEVELPMAAS